jgi:hypothetical protein
MAKLMISEQIVEKLERAAALRWVDDRDDPHKVNEIADERTALTAELTHYRPGSRPFLLGFEAFGVMALILFFGLAICFPREVVMPYLEPFLSRIATIIGQGRPFVLIPIECFVAVVLLGWPQLAFALRRGFLSAQSDKVD